MSGNNLLLWMSAKGSGSLQMFRKAMEELRVDPEKSARLLMYDFTVLAHSEFRDQNWRVTPSTIALTKQSNIYRGVVNGGRSPKLLAAIERGFPGLEITIKSNSVHPDAVIISSEDFDPIMEFAEGNGLRIQQDAATRLLISYGHDFIQANYRAGRPPPWTRMEDFSLFGPKSDLDRC